MNREFTVSTGYKIFYGLISLLFIGTAVYFMSLHNTSGNNAVFILPVLFLAVGIIIMLSQFKRKLVITDTTIISISLFKTTELAFADIKGYRVGPKNNTLYLEPTTSVPKLTITNLGDFKNSGDLKTWVETNFTNLDDTDYKDQLAHILNDNNLGFTTQERQAQLDRAKYISWIYNGGGIALFFISLFFTGKEAVIAPLVMIYPILSLAVVLLTKGLVKIIDKKKSPYPHILFGILAPLFTQIITIGQNHILQFDNFWVPFVVMAVILMAVFYYVDRVNNASPVNGQIFILLFFSALYGFGSVQQLNRVYDTSAEQLYQATVLSEYVSHGKSTSYNLRLSPWGPEADQKTLSVSRNMYYQTPVGSAVKMHLHKGYFNIPWYTVSD